MFTSAHWEIIQIWKKNMCNACFYLRGFASLTCSVFEANYLDYKEFHKWI